MKKSVFILLLLSFVQQAAAQSFDKSKYSVVIPAPKENLYMVGVGGDPQAGDFKSTLWGFVNASGDVLLEPIYEQIGTFVSGMAPVRRKGRYGFINDQFDVVIPCQYTAVGAFNERGFVWVNQGGEFDNAVIDMVTGGTFGVYDKNGNVIVPVKFKALGTFNLAKAKNGHPFVNFTAIPEALKDMERDAGVFDVHDYSYIDARMNVPMSMHWDDNIVVSLYGTHQKDGIISSKGEQLLPPDKFDDIYAPSEGMVPVSRYYSGGLQANYYRISSGGLMFTNWVNVDCITPFFGGIAIMTVHNKNTIISSSGAKIGSPYEIILPSESDYYVVSQEGKYGLVKKDGSVAIQPSFAVILPMREGLMLSRREKGGKICYVDVTGAVAIETDYDYGTSFHNGCAIVKRNEQSGVIDNKGKTIVSCRFFSIVPPSEPDPELIWVRKEKGGLHFCIDTKNDTFAFESSFLKVNNYNEHFSGVAFIGTADGKFGCVDSKGEFIIPSVMEDITQALNNYSAMCKDGKTRWTETDLWRWNLRQAGADNLQSVYSTLGENEWDY